MSYANERRTHFEEKLINEFGSLITLFLGIAFATTGFVITHLLSREFNYANHNGDVRLIIIGTSGVAISICIFLYLLLYKFF